MSWQRMSEVRMCCVQGEGMPADLDKPIIKIKHVCV